MRFAFLFLLILLLGCARRQQLEGVYFSRQQDALIFDRRESLLENHAAYFEESLRFRQRRHNLVFRQVGYGSSGLIHWRYVTRYRFRILNNSPDSLLLSPASRAAKQFFHNRDSIAFRSKYDYADRQTAFTKIIFHSGRCFGLCHDLHLELDGYGNLKVTDNGHGMKGLPCEQLNNNYRATLSSDDLERLHNILRLSQLKTLQWPSTRHCYDAPDLTLIIYRNNNACTYLRINAACEPVLSRPLTRFLYSLFTYRGLQRVDSTFTYER